MTNDLAHIKEALQNNTAAMLQIDKTLQMNTEILRNNTMVLKALLK